MRKYQYYNTGDDNDRDMYGVNHGAQSFTPTIDHLIGSVKLKLFRVGDPETITVSIKATTAGKPVGADLCSGTIEGTEITLNAAGEWYEIPLGNGFSLEKDTQYAIVVKAPDGDASNKVSWRADITSPTYTGGTYCGSTDSGVSWSTYSGVDCMFEEWGVGPPSATAVVWGNLPKSQISSEKVEAAIDRIIQDHEDDPNAHLETGESLESHKASAIIDHIVNSIITDKIKDGIITNPKITATARAYTAIVDINGDGDYTDIQDAIDYVHGLGGGAILILPGTYTQTDDITLYDNVSLIGFDKETTIIDFNSLAKRIKSLGDASPYSTGTISVNYASATVTGVGTTWQTTGWNDKYIRINNVWYEIKTVDSTTQITLEKTFKGEDIAGDTYEIAKLNHSVEIKKVSVINASVAGGLGIQFKYTKKSEISECFVGSNRYGIDLSHCSGIKITKCVMPNNAIGPLWASYCDHISIDFNDFSNSAVNVAFSYVIHSEFKNNKCVNMNFGGIGLGHCDYNNIESNFIDNGGSYRGIDLYDSCYNIIANNQANKQGQSGIAIDSDSDYNVITGNQCNHNGHWGIRVWYSSANKNIIVGNQLQDNGDGGLKDEGTDTEIGHNAE